MTTVPFSARNRREKDWIEEDFPASARNGLLHLLNDAIDNNYVSGWPIVAKELRRIVRVDPRNYDGSYLESIKQARNEAEALLNRLEWQRVYDLCERLYNHLAQGTVYERNGEVVTITKSQSQLFFAEEMQRLFEEESLGYEFRDGLVQRRGKRHTVNQVNKAERALTDLRLEAARKIFQKPFAISGTVRNQTLKMQ